jgi:hypothetical protein
LPPATVAAWKTSLPEEKPVPFQYCPLETRRTETCTDCTPEPAPSEAVPQKPLVAQPASQVAFV